MTAVIAKHDPCESCDYLKRLRSRDYYQPDEFVCGQSGTDAFECPRKLRADLVNELQAELVALAERLGELLEDEA